MVQERPTSFRQWASDEVMNVYRERLGEPAPAACYAEGRRYFKPVKARAFRNAAELADDAEK